jgi:ABC-type lipoprotein export system ATPase subunit
MSKISTISECRTLGSTGSDIRGKLQDLFEPSEPFVFIAVMGMAGAGKSTFISHCADEEVAISEPGALRSFKPGPSMISR